MKRTVELIYERIEQVESEWKEAMSKLENRIEDLEAKIERITASTRRGVDVLDGKEMEG